MSFRLVAVLGYSNGGVALHPICASRLRRAQAEARGDDVVLLSGWARRRRYRSEAELMAEAWRGPAARLVVSRDAGTTFGNAWTAAQVVRRLRPAEVVLVTSRWHQLRAAALFRAALRGTGIRLVMAPAEGSARFAAQLRELLCWPLVPLQAALAARRSQSLSDRSDLGRARGDVAPPPARDLPQHKVADPSGKNRI